MQIFRVRVNSGRYTRRVLHENGSGHSDDQLTWHASTIVFFWTHNLSNNCLSTFVQFHAFVHILRLLTNIYIQSAPYRARRYAVAIK